MSWKDGEMRIVLVLIGVAAILAGCVSSGAASREGGSTPKPSTWEVPTASPSGELATPGAASPTAVASPVDPSPSPSAAPTTEPTSPPIPPKPTGVTFDTLYDGDTGGVSDIVEITQTVTWQAPRDEGVEIRVYGVTECLARPDDPAPGTSGPCLVVNTRLPESIRVLLATAPASAGSVSWSWKTDASCLPPWIADFPDGPQYYAVVLGAYGPSDHSVIFAIAEPGSWYEPTPDEVIC